MGVHGEICKPNIVSFGDRRHLASVRKYPRFQNPHNTIQDLLEIGFPSICFIPGKCLVMLRSQSTESTICVWLVLILVHLPFVHQMKITFPPDSLAISSIFLAASISASVGVNTSLIVFI